MRRTKNIVIIKCAVYNALGVGRENSISRAELIKITGYKDRRIREAIEALRKDRVILNLDKGDGYYIPDSTPQGQREAAEWLERQDRRIQSMKDSTRGARRFVAGNKKSRRTGDMPGQFCMFGAGL